MTGHIEDTTLAEDTVKKSINRKAKGYRNELKTRYTLEAAGYTCIRAGGSLGMFDIIAFGLEGVRLIQVKTNSNASAAERLRISGFTQYPPNMTTKEIWVWYDRVKKPDIFII